MSEKSLSQDFQTFQNDKLVLAYQSVKISWYVSLFFNLEQAVKLGMVFTYCDFTFSNIFRGTCHKGNMKNHKNTSSNIVVYKFF